MSNPGDFVMPVFVSIFVFVFLITWLFQLYQVKCPTLSHNYYYLPEFNATCNDCYMHSISKDKTCIDCDDGNEYYGVRVIKTISKPCSRCE